MLKSFGKWCADILKGVLVKLITYGLILVAALFALYFFLDIDITKFFNA